LKYQILQKRKTKYHSKFLFLFFAETEHKYQIAETEEKKKYQIAETEEKKKY
jgi:hypothetical protein